MARRKVLVIGLGNPDRGDDGVGAMVAQDLSELVPPDVAVLARRGNLLSLIEDWAGYDALVCIDAAAPLRAPGRIHRVDLCANVLLQGLSLTSSHALGLVETIQLARILGLAPRDIVVYAIEASSFDDGRRLTPAVAAAVRVVTRRVMAEVRRLQRNSIAARIGCIKRGPAEM